MTTLQQSLGFTEKVILALRSLYSQYGYAQYRMNKFEEYDLYARNKDFLISDNVITFTDVDGKLMALKPDVTLSIVKNSKDLPDTVQKLFYNENVYRVTKGSHSFREIMQVGLECLGRIDDYCITEVLQLAAESLCHICENSVLDVSHLGLLSEFLDALGIPPERKSTLLGCVGEKNVHELAEICRGADVPEKDIQLLSRLVTLCGTPKAVLPQVEALLGGKVRSETLTRFTRVMSALEDTAPPILQIDFSAVGDIRYYNGIVFKGFIAGLPSSVLSGGQYDNLMQKMHRKSGAVGFAVYTDMLERLDRTANEYDVDAVLLYEEKADLAALRRQVRLLTGRGLRVLSLQNKPENIRYRQLLALRGDGVEVMENNA